MTVEALRAEIDHGAMTAFTEVVFNGLAGIVPIRMLAETGTPDQKPQSKFVEATQLMPALPDLAKHAARAARGLYAVPGIVSKPGSARATCLTGRRTVKPVCSSAAFGTIHWMSRLAFVRHREQGKGAKWAS